MRRDGLYTPTRVETAGRCYRRHILGNVLERASAKEPRAASTEFGTCLHSGAAAWWSTNESTFASKAALIQWNAGQQWMDDKHSEGLLASMMGYYCASAKLAGIFEGPEYKIVQVEQRLEVELEGCKLSFQVDRLVARGMESLILVDTKSAARLDYRWHNSWARSLQMRLYFAGIKKLYDLPVQVIVEGVLKSVPSKIEYELCPDWSDGEIQEAVEVFKTLSLRDRQLLLDYPDDDELTDFALTRSQYNPQDCFSYNRPCPFLKLCEADTDKRRGLLDGEYIVVPGEY